MDIAMLKSNFPFTAVGGQSPVKLALTLLAIDPAIGGVLVSGVRLGGMHVVGVHICGVCVCVCL